MKKKDEIEIFFEILTYVPKQGLKIAIPFAKRLIQILSPSKKQKRISSKISETKNVKDIDFPKVDKKSIVPPIAQEKIITDFDLESARKEFVTKRFSGIYESIYRVANGKTPHIANIVDDWHTRLCHMEDDCPNARKYWLSLFENYEKLTPDQLRQAAETFVKFIYSTGIKRDEREELVVDETTQDQYFNLDEDLVTGAKMKVKSACWTYGDKVFETGWLISI